MPFRLLLASLSLMLLAACAIYPKMPAPPPLSGRDIGTVGVVVEFEGSPIHTHVGTTVFNNFEKPYPFEWEMAAAIEAAFHAALAEAGFQAVDVGELVREMGGVDNLVVAEGDRWVVSERRKAQAAALANGAGIDVIVRISQPSERFLVNLECGNFGCSEHYASGWGMFSRSILGIERFVALPGFLVDVYTIAPPANLAYSGALQPYQDWRKRQVPMRGFASPVVFKEMTEAEWQPVREAIIEYARTMGAEVARRLRDQ